MRQRKTHVVVGNGDVAEGPRRSFVARVDAGFAADQEIAGHRHVADAATLRGDADAVVAERVRACCGRIHAPVDEVITDGYWGGTAGDPNCVWMPGGAIIARAGEVIPRNEAPAEGPDAVSSRVDEVVVGNVQRTRRNVDRGEATRGRIADESTIGHGQIGPGVVLADSERTCRSVESTILDGVVLTHDDDIGAAEIVSIEHSPAPLHVDCIQRRVVIDRLTRACRNRTERLERRRRKRIACRCVDSRELHPRICVAKQLKFWARTLGRHGRERRCGQLAGDFGESGVVERRETRNRQCVDLCH